MLGDKFLQVHDVGNFRQLEFLSGFFSQNKCPIRVCCGHLYQWQMILAIGNHQENLIPVDGCSVILTLMSSLYGVVSHFWRIYSTALLFFIFCVSFLESCDDFALIVQNLKILLGSIILVETKLTGL